MQPVAEMLRKVIFVNAEQTKVFFQQITLPTRGRLEIRSNILDLVITNERGMVASILHESPLGKSDHSVVVIKFICYAELVNIERMKYYTLLR